MGHPVQSDSLPVAEDEEDGDPENVEEVREVELVLLGVGARAEQMVPTKRLHLVQGVQLHLLSIVHPLGVK